MISRLGVPPKKLQDTMGKVAENDPGVPIEAREALAALGKGEVTVKQLMEGTRITSRDIISYRKKHGLTPEPIRTAVDTMEQGDVKSAGKIAKDIKKVKDKPEGKGTVAEEGIKKVSAPKEAEWTFTSKKGNEYYKIGEKWFKDGKEVKSPFVIKAAENNKKIAGETVKLEDPAVIEAQQDRTKNVQTELTQVDKDMQLGEAVETPKPKRAVTIEGKHGVVYEGPGADGTHGWHTADGKSFTTDKLTGKAVREKVEGLKEVVTEETIDVKAEPVPVKKVEIKTSESGTRSILRKGKKKEGKKITPTERALAEGKTKEEIQLDNNRKSASNAARKNEIEFKGETVIEETVGLDTELGYEGKSALYLTAAEKKAGVKVGDNIGSYSL